MSRILIRNDTSKGSDDEILEIAAVLVEEYKKKSIGSNQVYSSRYWYKEGTGFFAETKIQKCSIVIVTEKVTIFEQTFDCIVVMFTDED